MTKNNKPPNQTLILLGSSLSEFEPLLPAEEKLRICAARGEDCIVDGYVDVTPQAVSVKNKIRAAFLRYMILGGCGKSPTHARGIKLIGAFVVCDENGANGYCLDLEAAVIDHDIGLFNCKIDGSVMLLGASVKSLFLDGCSVEGFLAERLKTTGGVFLREGFRATSEVRLYNSKLSGSLDCNNGRFDCGLDGQDATIGGSVLLGEGFVAYKTILLRNAIIGGNLECKGGFLYDPNIALIANRAKINGNVNIAKVEAKGTIALTGTDTGGDFISQGAILEGTPALQLRNSKIGGTLFWRTLGLVSGEVDFGGTCCTTINMDGRSWMRKRPDYPGKFQDTTETVDPKEISDQDNCNSNGQAQEGQIQNTTKLTNFTYKGFSALPEGCKAGFWIEWLKQQPDDHLTKRFRALPWAQLAEVLESMGYEEEARDIRIEKQRLQTRFMAEHEPAATCGFDWRHQLHVFWRRALWGPLVDYGYRPGKAILYLAVMVIIGTIIYWQAALHGVMTPTHPLIYNEARVGGMIPTKCAENWVYFPEEASSICQTKMPSEYSEFQSFIYAMDVALPVVNLRMENDWAPRVVDTKGKRHWLGWWVRTYEWFLIAVGWILSLMFVSAVGASIRR